MNHCYYCGAELSKENESAEHIIPNALGGRWRSKKLLCYVHNRQLGDSIDAPLNTSFHAIANFLSIGRDRKDVAAIRTMPLLKRASSNEICFYCYGREVLSKTQIAEQALSHSILSEVNSLLL